MRHLHNWPPRRRTWTVRHQRNRRPTRASAPPTACVLPPGGVPVVRASSLGQKGTWLLCPNAQTGPTRDRGFGPSGLSGGSANVVVVDGLAVRVHVAVVVHDRRAGDVRVRPRRAQPPVAVATFGPVPTCMARMGRIPHAHMRAMDFSDIMEPFQWYGGRVGLPRRMKG